jgi:hypothetical protein
MVNVSVTPIYHRIDSCNFWISIAVRVVVRYSGRKVRIRGLEGSLILPVMYIEDMSY